MAKMERIGDLGYRSVFKNVEFSSDAEKILIAKGYLTLRNFSFKASSSREPHYWYGMSGIVIASWDPLTKVLVVY